MVNRASYSNKISTVIRTAREARIDVNLQPEDLGGQDTLPNHLQNAHIDLGHGTRWSYKGAVYVRVRQPAVAAY
jgi:hypothetical protein